MAGKPVPSRRMTNREIDFEERASGIPIAGRSPSGYPPPVPAGPEPFTYDRLKAQAEHELEFPEGYEAHVRATKPGKVGTFEDILRVASVSMPRESGF